MRIIAYCDDCFEFLKGMPNFYWNFYQRIVEEMIIYNQAYPLISTLDPDVSYTSDFLKCFEENGLLLSCERGHEEVWIIPIGINYIESKRKDLDLYQVCLDIDTHHTYEFDENLIED